LSTCHLTVGITGFDHEASQVERILHELVSLLLCQSLGLTKLHQQIAIRFTLSVVCRINDLSLVDVLETKFGSLLLYFCRGTDQDQVGYVVCE